MSLGQHTCRDPALHRCRQPQESHGVGQLRSRAADPRSELLLGAAEVRQQLGVRRGLLQRVELGALQVLDQGVAEQESVSGV